MGGVTVKKRKANGGTQEGKPGKKGKTDDKDEYGAADADEGDENRGKKTDAAVRPEMVKIEKVGD